MQTMPCQYHMCHIYPLVIQPASQPQHASLPPTTSTTRTHTAVNCCLLSDLRCTNSSTTTFREHQQLLCPVLPRTVLHVYCPCCIAPLQWFLGSLVTLPMAMVRPSSRNVKRPMAGRSAAAAAARTHAGREVRNTGDAPVAARCVRAVRAPLPQAAATAVVTAAGATTEGSVLLMPLHPLHSLL